MICFYFSFTHKAVKMVLFTEFCCLHTVFSELLTMHLIKSCCLGGILTSFTACLFVFAVPEDQHVWEKIKLCNSFNFAAILIFHLHTVARAAFVNTFHVNMRIEITRKLTEAPEKANKYGRLTSRSLLKEINPKFKFIVILWMHNIFNPLTANSAIIQSSWVVLWCERSTFHTFPHMNLIS